MLSIRQARRTVPKPKKGLVVVKRNFFTRDIMKLIEERAKEDFSYLKNFIKENRFTADYEGVKRIYNWFYKNIKYKDDTDKYGDDWQIVQSPAQLIHSGEGDCKSITLAIKAILDLLGIPNKIRYVQYNWMDNYKHVYPVAVIDGNEVVLDVVYGYESGYRRFNKELPSKYVKRKKDKVYNMPLAKLGSTGTGAALEEKQNKKPNKANNKTDWYKVGFFGLLGANVIYGISKIFKS